jgi:hypothetical protein
MKHIALVLVLLMVATSANAAITRILKETIMGGDVNDSRHVQVEVEDARIAVNNVTSYPSDTPRGSGSLMIGPEVIWTPENPNDDWYWSSLIGIADMINLLPDSTVAGPDDIVSATLLIRQRYPAGGEVIGIRKVTSPWLFLDAEDSVTALHRVPGGEDPYWLADIGKTPGTDPSGNPDYSGFVGFGAGDYDGTSGAQITIVDTTPHIAYEVDITQIVRDWVAGGEMANQGVCLVWEYTGTEPWTNDCPYFNYSESQSSWDRLPDGSDKGPEFIITYAPEPVTIGLLAIGGLALIRRKR